MEKRILLTFILSGLVFGYCGYIIGLSAQPANKHIKQNVHNSVKDSINVNQTKSLCLMFADSVDGRPTYTVMFNDTTVLESMYPEEIANGLSEKLENIVYTKNKRGKKKKNY